MELTRKKKIIYIFAVVIGIITITVLFGKALIAVLMPITAALVISFLLRPPVEYMAKRMPVRAAILLSYVMIVAVVALIIMTIVPIAVNQISELKDILPELKVNIDTFIAGIQESFDKWGVAMDVGKIMQNLISDPNQRAADIIKSIISVLSSLGSIAAIPVLTFYLLKDGRKMYAKLAKILPEPKREKWLKRYHCIRHTLWRFIVGQAFLALLICVVTTTVLALLGVRFSLLLGIFMGLMEFVPYFGPYVGAIPVALSAVTGGMGLLIAALVAVLIIQQLEGSFLYPVIIGKNTGIHPAGVIISILAGGEILGVLGMVLSVPTVIVFSLIIRSVYEDFVRRDIADTT